MCVECADVWWSWGHVGKMAAEMDQKRCVRFRPTGGTSCGTVLRGGCVARRREWLSEEDRVRARVRAGLHGEQPVGELGLGDEVPVQCDHVAETECDGTCMAETAWEGTCV